MFPMLFQRLSMWTFALAVASACATNVVPISTDGLIAADWPTYQHDFRRSGYSLEKIDARRLRLAWDWRSPAAPQTAWAGPAKWDAYAGQRGLPSMRSYDPVFHVIAAGDFVYFGSSVDDSLHCLDAKNGDEKWSFTTDGPIRVAPTHANGKLYFGSDDGYAYCLRANDGALVWKFRPAERGQLILNNGRFIPFAPCRTGVLVAGGTAYFGNSLLPWKESYLCGIDAKTGKPVGKGRFVHKLKSLTLEGPPAVSSQLLIFPQGRVAPRVFNRADGKDRGSLKKSGGGSIVVVSIDAKVFHGPAADPRKGAINSNDAKTLEMVAGYGKGNALVVAAHISYMLTNDELIASDLVKRKVLWKTACDCPHALIAAGDVLFAGGTDHVAAFSASDGSQLWQHAVDGKAYGLAAANGRLLVSTDVGAIYAFATKDGSKFPLATPIAKHENAPPNAGATDDKPLLPVENVNDKRLVGRWVFQQPHLQRKTVRDLAGELDATISGKIDLQKSGQHQALVLDGSSQQVLIRADHTRAKLPATAITAVAWVRIDRTQAWGGIVGAIQDNGKYERGWLLGFRDSKFSFAVTGKQGPGKLTYLTDKADFVKGRWYHVVGTYDGSTMRLFVNGQLTSSSTEQKGAINYPPRAFYEIGAYHDQDEYFRTQGRVHEVRVYKAALSPAEVAADFKAKSVEFPLPTPKLNLATGPWLQFTAPGEATVRWQTQKPSPSILEYTLDGRTAKLLEPAMTTQHEVQLAGLKHNRIYSYVIKTKTDGQLAVTRQFECDTFFNYNLPPVAEPGKTYTNWYVTAPYIQAARHIVKQTHVTRGICLVYGSSQGLLAYELARQTRLRIIGIDDDADMVASARRNLKAAGVYGHRVTIQHVDDYAKLPFVGHFANLVVSDRMLHASDCPGTAAELFRVLRPDGGVAFVGQLPDKQQSLTQASLRQWFDSGRIKAEITDDQYGIWGRVDRAALPDAGAWSHLYGRSDNSAFGGEGLAGATSSDDLDVQWIGRPGPRYQADRNGRKPSPLSTAGRLFLQGLNRIVAVDAFNGSVLWSLEIPDLQRFNMPRDCGNWCADRDYVYAAIRGRCWQIDATDGMVSQFHDVVPAKAKGWKSDWGYLASDGNRIVGSAVKQATSWTEFWGNAGAGWYDARAGAVTDKICSDNLFALDKESGKSLWTHADGVVLNSTISIGGGKVYFVECRNPKVLASPDRRIGMPELWQDQYLVALNASSGSKLWEQPLKTQPGKVVFFMAHSGNRLVIVASNNGKYHVYGFAAENGQRLWNQSFGWPGGKGDHGKAMSRPAIVGNKVFVRPQAFSLSDGKPLKTQMPGGGCGTYACSTNALFFRSSTVTMWDLNKAKATSWNRLRPDCWLSTIPAGGMLLSPEGGGGCSCGGWMETSVGFMPLSRRQPPNRR